MNKQEIPEWFDGEISDEGSVAYNSDKSKKVELNNIESSIYNYILGYYLMASFGAFNTDHKLNYNMSILKSLKE
jgi:hypothetical protein